MCIRGYYDAIYSHMVTDTNFPLVEYYDDKRKMISDINY